MTDAPNLVAALRRIEASQAHSAKVQLDIVARLTTVEELSKKTVGVVEAWDAVKTGGQFLKWLGGICTSIGVVWVALKTGIGFWGK